MLHCDGPDIRLLYLYISNFTILTVKRLEKFIYCDDIEWVIRGGNDLIDQMKLILCVIS